MDKDDGSASYLGAYTGQIQIIDDDFPKRVLPSDGTIDPGDTVTGTIDFEADTDQVALNVEENGIYRIVMTDATSSFYTTVKQYFGFSSWTTGVGGETELYFVAVNGADAEITMRGWTEGATYSYTVERIGTDDHNGLQSQATLLQDGDALDGNIAFNADVGAFEIVGVSGSTYTVTIDLDDADTLDGLSTSLLNDFDDNAAATVTTTATQITYEWTFQRDETYFLEVGTTLGSAGYDAVGDYTVSLSVTPGPRIIHGTDHGDHIIGTDEGAIYRTYAGDDTVSSGGGDDSVDLGLGDDVAIAGAGRETFDGGYGDDLLSYYRSEGGVHINLLTDEAAGGWAEGDTFRNFSHVSGSLTGDDVIRGSNTRNIIKTHGGDDWVYAGRGNNQVILGAGDDYVLVGGGRETFHGGAGNDYISYVKSAQGVTVNLAKNTASGSWAEDDKIFGFESVSGSKTGHDTIYGTTGANTIKTYGGNDQIFASKGNDRVYDGAGNDLVFLGDNDDYILVGGGADEIHGGLGNDYISYINSTDGVHLNLTTNKASGGWAEDDSIHGFESASGSKTGKDVIYGTAGANTIKTYGGNDKVYARGGADTVHLGDGNDYVLAGEGTGEFHGGNGVDYISYYSHASGVFLNLETNTVTGTGVDGQVISGFENASGSETGNDTIYGSETDNILKTYGGDDIVHAGRGRDTVYSGAGNDQVLLSDGDDFAVSGGGIDHYDGGSGFDVVNYNDSASGVVIDLAANTASGGWADGDTLVSIEGISGSDGGNDQLAGNAGRNYLDGFAGNDTLYGRDGDDLLVGRAGDDVLFGGNGDDRLSVGVGTNAMTGGSGYDTFDFNMEDFEGGAASHTVIVDFEDDVDTLEINSSGQVDEDIFSYATQQGNDVVFSNFGNTTLIIRDMTIADLQDDVDFNWV